MSTKTTATVSSTVAGRYAQGEWVAFALNLCRGRYQRAIVRGRQRLSGADLRGKASSYSGRYAASRRAILDRIAAAGIPHAIVRSSHGRLDLVIGEAL